MGDVRCRAQQRDPLALAPEVTERRALVVERFGDDPVQMEVLGEREGPIGRGHGFGRAPGAHVAAGEVAEQRRPHLLVDALAVLGDGALQHHDCLERLTGIDEHFAEERLAAGGGNRIGGRSGALDCGSHELLRQLVLRRDVRRAGGAQEETRLFAGSRLDGDGLSKVRDRLVVGAQGRRALGCSREGESRLNGHRLGFRAFRRRLVRGQIVRRQRAGQLVVAERLEVARGREMPGAPFAAREGSVGDLADERLDEAVLAALRADADRSRRRGARAAPGLGAWVRGRRGSGR